jgi:hypothetical protein
MGVDMRYILHSDRTAVLQAVSEAPDGHYVEIKPSTRTSEQNRLYWAELGTLADKCGHTPELWHEFFKKHFLTSEAVEMAGEVIIMSPSTTKLSKAQFADYIEQVFAWLAVNVK